MSNLLRDSFLSAAAVIGTFLTVIGMYGAIGWLAVREAYGLPSEIPLAYRVIHFVCGFTMLPLYPFWALGCWMLKVSRVGGNKDGDT